MAYEQLNPPLPVLRDRRPGSGGGVGRLPNRKTDMRFRKKSYLRNKERSEADRQKKGGFVKNAAD